MEPQQAQLEPQAPARKDSRTSTETIRPAVPEAVAAGEDSASQTQQVASAEPSANEPVSNGNDVSATPETVAQAPESDSKRPEKLTLANLESEAAASGVDLPGSGRDGMRTPAPETQQTFYSLNELHTKDAYLVFRALCKLGMKPLGVERYAMRKKRRG